MAKQILIIQGHPDASEKHFGHALADAYAEGARQAGYEVRQLNVAELDIPLLHSKRDWDQDAPQGVTQAQQAIAAADHLVIFYPLWQGGMPAVFKGFLEQVLRPGFTMTTAADGQRIFRLKGKSARVVVTMGMPALAYRFYFGAHSLKCLKRNILQFIGIRPVRSTVIGMIEGITDDKRGQWLEGLRELGAAAA